MKKNLIFIALFRAFDRLYEETHREDLVIYLSEANPYLFTDRKSADPAVFAGFCDYFDQFYINDDISAEDAFIFVKKYLTSEHLSYYGNFAPVFEDISLEEWMKLCSIVEVEETK